MTSLPLCVQYIQALGPSFVAVIAALIAGYIALRQWWTARDKLRFDLFEKRFAIYEATKKGGDGHRLLATFWIARRCGLM